jgi:hypothetical protein
LRGRELWISKRAYGDSDALALIPFFGVKNRGSAYGTEAEPEFGALIAHEALRVTSAALSRIVLSRDITSIAPACL